MAERVELVAGPPAHGGHCVARAGERVVFLRHALPGERVLAEVTEERARFWRAEAVEILDPSPDRVPSRWPEAGPGGVGGGELAHVSLPAQREWKRAVLADVLRRVGGAGLAEEVAALPGAGPLPGHLASAGSLAVPAVAALPGDDSRDGLATRTRVSLTVDAEGRAGMHRHRSGEIRALNDLPLAHEAIAALGLLGAGSPWRRHWRPGARVEAVAPSAPGSEPLVLVDGEPADRRGRRRSTTPPRRTVRELVPSVLGELAYRVSGSGFWQVHRAAPELLVEAVLRAAGGAEVAAAAATALEGRRILELYSGAGLLTLPLARAVGESGAVVSLEGSARAVRDARRNLHEHPWALLGQARVDADTVRESVAGMPAGRPDIVLLDPPRAGAGGEVMRAVAALGPARVVLVACDPAALARDLATARAAGYRLAALEPYDLFPHTHHLEVVATVIR